MKASSGCVWYNYKVMNDSPEKSEQSAATIRPPQIFRSLVGGFHAVATNIGLILLPLALDLLLWFGPHLRVKQLFEPILLQTLDLMRQYYPSNASEALKSMEETAKTFLERYNLLGTLSTFPIGVPSQMASMMPIQTPTGSPQILEVHSAVTFFFGWLGLTMLGFILASVYFAIVARACSQMPAEPAAEDNPGPGGPARLLGRTGNSLPSFRISTLAWETLQIITLVILLLIVVTIIMMPVMIVVSLLAQISVLIAWIALMVVGFALIWFMVPLIFSPHGIFLCGQSLFNAMLNSTRVVRYSLPGTGLFLTAVILLSQMMNSLWISAPETSWMAMVGIFGHAFVSTALLAATFLYYRSGLAYAQTVRGLARKSI